MIELNADPYVAEQQIRAVLFSLVAFGYIDAEFAQSEKLFIRKQLAPLVAQLAAQYGGHNGGVEELTARYEAMLDQYDETIRGHFSESVADGETTRQFVISRLKLGCFEVLRHFDADGQQAVLQTVQQLMLADGVEHPEERAFCDDLYRLVEASKAAQRKPGWDPRQRMEARDTEPAAATQTTEAVLHTPSFEPPPPGGMVRMAPPQQLTPSQADHPFFHGYEQRFADDPELFARQSETEMALVHRVLEGLHAQREAGAGRLAQAQHARDFEPGAPFLDGFTYVIPPSDKNIDMLVLGDLHGCYSCLKAALMQGDFIGKVERYRNAPDSHPMPYLVLLGDYIDRGRFSYSGTLRAAMNLFVHFPEHVFVLRGNHEYYIEMNGQVVAPVRPCEAMEEIAAMADNNIFVRYMHLFDSMPNTLLFDQLCFLHGGVPRTDSLEERWQGLHSLNDPVMRFEMLWSDPCDADIVPVELQQESARFPFGRIQFQHFMAKLGCHTLIRGHERITSGFLCNYDDPQARLITLFSSGGATNADLPEDSNYRDVTPAAMTIEYRDGETTLTPFLLDYASYNDPAVNGFFR